MNHFFQQLFNLGISSKLPLSEKRSIRFTNFSLIYGLAFCLLCFLTNLMLMGKKESLLPLVFSIPFGIGFYYQQKHQFAWTKLFILSIAIIGVILSCWIFGLKGYPYYMFLLTFCIGMVFYPQKKQQLRLLGIHLLCLTVALGLSPFIKPIVIIPLPLTFGLLTFLFVFMLLFFIIYTYTNENQRFAEKTEQLVGSLQQQKNQIEQQAIHLQTFNNRLQKEILEKNIIQEQLKHSNEKLKRFVYIASHDLKEPLRSIGGFTQILDRKLKSKLDSPTQEYLNYITGGVDRMTNLLDDLLQFARVDKEEVLKKEKINLKNLIIMLQHNLNHLIKKNKGKIIIEKELPTIIGNSTQINQLFQNLISNALKFKKEEAPIIKISFEESSKAFTFSIKDNGIGIVAAHQEKIFDAFQRLHKNTYEGSGIGLAICKKVVQNHHGKIWLTSEPGVGTTFFFTLEKSRSMKKIQPKNLASISH